MNFDAVASLAAASVSHSDCTDHGVVLKVEVGGA